MTPVQPAGRPAPACTVCDHHHGGRTPTRRSLDEPAGCPGCAGCDRAPADADVPPAFGTGHLLVLSCLEDLSWEEGDDVVGLVPLARRFALHAWPAVLPVAPRHPAWADPTWLVEDCHGWALLEVHVGLPSTARSRPGAVRPTPVAVSLTSTGRRVLDVVTWRPRLGEA